MMEYRFIEIEEKWRTWWKDTDIYRVENPVNHKTAKPKFYVLDMFPYPSGAGLHVGHPLGYIASDIYSRYKRLKGFNVLHPMGFDSFGLPAEQYAIESGQHPARTTIVNIATFRQQLDKIGFCYDWSREVRTSDPDYYRWTQWLFLQLFNSYFCNTQQKARPISDLIRKYETKGSGTFSATDWNGYTKEEQGDILMRRRLAYSAFGDVNWCEALGTVLANDEVINGFSERGGHPVIKKKMRQWYLRITAYADRLLEGLEKVDFSDSMKEMQCNWIGKSEGAEILFAVAGQSVEKDFIKVYTTRPDTIFGVDFIVLAPEHDLVNKITTSFQRSRIHEYVSYVKSRSDRERMVEVKQVTGCFTGAYVLNPFNGKKIPVWISEYVLAGYGTGAIMAVPCGDQRDFLFAKHFDIPVTNIIGEEFSGLSANSTKTAILSNSGFLSGMEMIDAIPFVIKKLEEDGVGKRKVNYRMRDAGFSRQRYWGEPFPIVWLNDQALPLSENELPVTLPHVDNYRPGAEGEGPLSNIPEWVNVHVSIDVPPASEPAGTRVVSAEQNEGFAAQREVSTMPGYAGSSWYFLRFMDPQNDKEFCSGNVSDYWNQVDVYVGGTEHAVGHLLYSRMWTKVMYDLGMIGFDEPFKKLVNQGMIQGSSRFIHRFTCECSSANGSRFERLVIVSDSLVESDSETNVTPGLQLKIDELLKMSFDQATELVSINRSRVRVDVNIVNGVELDLDALKNWRSDYKDVLFLLDNGKCICAVETEKMSKSKYNTVNPDDLVNRYGADTFRMYEMFLGPVEQSKPWDTKGIEGVYRFLKKLWRLFFDEERGRIWNSDAPTKEELRTLHRSIQKINADTESFSFNTAVSAFMICINELSELKCHKKEILGKVLILLAPYAPHISEELWHQLGNEGSILNAKYPDADKSLLQETTKEYPVSVNGKLRTTITLDISIEQSEAERLLFENDVVKKWLDGKEPKKIIFVKGKMINLVI